MCGLGIRRGDRATILMFCGAVCSIASHPFQAAWSLTSTVIGLL